MLNYNLKQLEVFTAVAELNSFTKAAEKLYLTQSTVSAHIRSLENALNVTLFYRDSKRRINLSPQGQKLYPAARRILNDCSELSSLAQNTLLQLPLLIGASTVPSQYLLPELMADFSRQYPDCRYLLKGGNSLKIHELLYTDAVRIGFVGSAVTASELSYVPLEEDRLVMVTANNEHFSRLKKKGLYGRDLLNEPVVAREEGSGTDHTLVNYMHEQKIPYENLHITARVDNPEMIKKMVERNSGVSVLSLLTVQREIEDGRLLSFDMDERGLQRNIFIVYKKHETLHSLERKFIESCRRYCAKKHLME